MKPERHTPPTVSNLGWCKNPVDQFILGRLDAEKLSPSKEADRASLLRRVSLDLIGLPPTIQELDAFQSDNSPDAYEKQVDRLLASPAFGERWASVWMDLARYADSEGLGSDNRRDVWKFRDWLIDSFNHDKPFDQFTIEQLAGDLLPAPTLDQLIATTFQRLTQSNDEGGTDDEEFRVVAVLDRVNTTWEVWQGQTFGCIQCHSHPYDPISHDEYYKFAAFFNQTRDADLSENLPEITVPLDRTMHDEAGKLQASIMKAESGLYELYSSLNKATKWLPVNNLEATGKGTILKTVDQDGFREFRTQGNVASSSIHQLAFQPEPSAPLTALKLELLPLDVAAARLTPEWGSFLKKIEVSILPADGSAPRPLGLARLIGDEEHPLFDPEISLHGGQGWGPYSKIDRIRWCVVIPQQPIVIAPGAKLQVTLANGGTIIASFPMVAKRGRLSITSDPAWTALLTRSDVTNMRETIKSSLKQLKAIPSTTVPVMRELEPAARRETHVFVRGNWLNKGDLINTPDVPALFPKIPDGVKHDRLALAKWLVSAGNPLTGRVAVNRFWLELFGTGIVETAEDFGSSGVKPYHPELLDDLAVRFGSEFKWSMKRLLRELATSATYRQSAVIAPGMAERDQSNRLLARGPRQRLTAEMSRDQALAVSGLISAKNFGEPTHPPIPAGAWKPFNGDPWKTPMPGDPERYRRSVYTYWKRSIPYPTFATFDAPTREMCSKRRLVSNTPLQALTVMNDPAFDECARALASWMEKLPTATTEGKLASGYRRVTSRTATPERIKQLAALYQKLEADYTKLPDPKAGPTPQASALLVAASVLLNLDEAMVR